MKRSLIRTAAVAAALLAVALGPALAADARPTKPKTAAGIEAVNRGDYKTAYELFRTQAAKGDPEAQFELGMLFALGKGVERNLVTAFMWAEIAARQNEPYASFIRDEVAANLTASEIGTARGNANDWMRANGYAAQLPAMKAGQ